MSEAGCTDLGTKLTASSQHGHRVLADVVMTSTAHLAHTLQHCNACNFTVSKSMIEMTCHCHCIGANAG